MKRVQPDPLEEARAIVFACIRSDAERCRARRIAVIRRHALQRAIVAGFAIVALGITLAVLWVWSTSG